jgi:hypothetical protein
LIFIDKAGNPEMMEGRKVRIKIARTAIKKRITRSDKNKIIMPNLRLYKYIKDSFSIA